MRPREFPWGLGLLGVGLGFDFMGCSHARLLLGFCLEVALPVGICSYLGKHLRPLVPLSQGLLSLEAAQS